eukprot:scpid105350/ scgid24806/ 
MKKSIKRMAQTSIAKKTHAPGPGEANLYRSTLKKNSQQSEEAEDIDSENPYSLVNYTIDIQPVSLAETRTTSTVESDIGRPSVCVSSSDFVEDTTTLEPGAKNVWAQESNVGSPLFRKISGMLVRQ